MEREGLTEEEAFARLRKASQISGRPLKVVAEALIATLGGSTGEADPPRPEVLPRLAYGQSRAAARPRAGGRGAVRARRRARRARTARATIAIAGRSTPSQTRTFSASSSVRSSRDGAGTAPSAPGVTTRELDRRHPRLGIRRSEIPRGAAQLAPERLQRAPRAGPRSRRRATRSRAAPTMRAICARTDRSRRSSASSVCLQVVDRAPAARRSAERRELDDRVLHLRRREHARSARRCPPRRSRRTR